jgi:predicted nucleic acid-binding Zn ribbon protein
MKPSRRRRDPARVGKPLAGLLARYDPEGRLRAYRVFDIWPEVVGEAIDQRTQPDRLRDGVLSVQVSSHTWMQELQFLKEDIRQRLNQRLESEVIRDLHFVPGRVRAAPTVKQPEAALAVVVPELPATGSTDVDDVLRRIATAAARRRAAASAGKRKRKKRKG